MLLDPGLGFLQLLHAEALRRSRAFESWVGEGLKLRGFTDLFCAEAERGEIGLALLRLLIAERQSDAKLENRNRAMLRVVLREREGKLVAQSRTAATLA
jgi:hypothetical protein